MCLIKACSSSMHERAMLDGRPTLVRPLGLMACDLLGVSELQTHLGNPESRPALTYSALGCSITLYYYCYCYYYCCYYYHYHYHHHHHHRHQQPRHCPCRLGTQQAARKGSVVDLRRRVQRASSCVWPAMC